MSVGIDAVAGYAPAYRLSEEAVSEAWGQFQAAGVSSTAVPAADEDALTMAAEAGAMAVDAASVEADALGGLCFGSSTPPYEEADLGARLVSFLGLADTAAIRQASGSTRAGVEALHTAVDLSARREAPVLALASDAPRGAHDDAIDHAAGTGAAGVVVAPDGTGSIDERATVSSPTPGVRFRRRGATESEGLAITAYDRSAYVDAVAGAVDGLGADLGTADAVALQAPNGDLPYRATGALGVETEAIQRGTTVHELGDTGAASPLLGLVSALVDGHTDLVVVGYGAGGSATAFTLSGAGVATRTALEGSATLSYGEYLRLRGDITPGEPAGGGGYVSVPSWRRTIPQRHRLVAGRCRECGSLALPPAGACTDCGTLDAYDEVTLPGTGTVEARTVIGQGGAPPEFVEQQARSGDYIAAIVALDGPDSGDEAVSMPAQVVTVGDTDVAIGDRVSTTIRRIYTQEGVTRYGVKMRPVAAGDP